MLLKDKLWHIKIFKNLFEHYPLEQDSTKLEAVRSTPQCGVGGKTYKDSEEAKKII